MMPEPITLIYGAVFLAAVLLVEGITLMLRDARRRSEQLASRRARLKGGGKGQTERVQILRPDAARAKGPIGSLAWMLAQSGVKISVYRFLLVVALLAAAFWLALVSLLSAPPVLSIVPAIAVGFALPLFVIVLKRRRRVRRFAELLPDALDMMVRSLRAGHPIKAAMGLVAKEMPDPIGQEFGLAVDEMTYGLELNEALENLRLRVEHPDLHYMVVAINIQHASGGNLAEVLTNLSTIIRDRFRLYKKVRAISAEGRMSGYVIGAVPFFIATVMTFNKPDYYTEAAGHPAFAVVAALGVFLYVAAGVAIWKIVNIRV